MRNKRSNGIILVIAAVIVALIAVGLAGWNYHKQPQFCSICHIMEPYVQSLQSPGQYAYIHGEAGLACLDCHEASLQQQIEELKIYLQGDYKDPLRERRYPQDWCFQCKEHGTYDELAERTSDRRRNQHASHFGEMECYTCHKMHRESELYCTYCHDDVALPAGWQRAR